MLILDEKVGKQTREERKVTDAVRIIAWKEGEEEERDKGRGENYGEWDGG